MDLRDLEEEVQRLVGYEVLVTSGVADKGPYINVNGRQELLRVWIPRSGTEAARVAQLVKAHFAQKDRPSYGEVTY